MVSTVDRWIRNNPRDGISTGHTVWLNEPRNQDRLEGLEEKETLTAPRPVSSVGDGR